MSVFLVALSLLSADAAEPIEISGAVVKLVDDVAVPATEAGLLAKILVKEGEIVAAGAMLAQILDADVRLAVERAKYELDIAQRQQTNDVDIRYARKSTEVAKAELARSLETNAKYPKTVSNTELDRQKLLVEKSELEIKQAEHDQEIASLTSDIKGNELRTAEEQLARRTITAPLKGMVVEVHRRPGEWVQPGETVARVVRLDRLRAEGFLAVKHARLDLVGSKVKLVIPDAEGKDREFAGVIVFVSPEIDPLNSQVRVWAEIDNSDLKLRPGVQANLLVQPR
ncbi:MAG: HlyD family efflux transporter periplasmic adaptor subunit [Pirellulaceae bacterium]|nr:HlyD family efflux transporter periplasmic adaptor subunit [Pirellulaceae bacterium]